jgi:hypothetical protein
MVLYNHSKGEHIRVLEEVLIMKVSKMTRKEFHRLIENLKIVADQLNEAKKENEKQEEGKEND